MLPHGALIRTHMSRSSQQRVERRASARVPSDIPAVARLPKGGTHEVRIANFCLGGMLLQFDRAMTPLLRRGDRIIVEFRADVEPQSVELATPAVVRHLHHDAVGVQFHGLTGQQEAVLRTLAEQLRPTAAERPWDRSGPQWEARCGQVRKLARDLWSRFGTGLVRGALDAAAEEYFQRTDGLRDEEEKAQILVDLRATDMVRHRRDLDALLDRHAAVHIDACTASATEGASGQADAVAGLSLVENEEVEDWLAKDAVANRISQENGEILERLRIRLECLLPKGAPVPLGPESLAGLLNDVLLDTGLADKERRRVLWSLGRPLAQTVGALYEAFDQALEEQGFGAPADASASEPPASDTKGPRVEQRPPETVDPDEDAQEPPEAAAAPGAAVRSLSTDRAQSIPAAAGAEPPVEQTSAGGSGIDTATRLRPAFEALRHLERHRLQQGPGNRPRNEGSEAASGHSVRDTLVAEMGEMGTGPAGRLAQAIDLIGYMERSLSDERVVSSPQSREWLGKLTPRLSEALLTDPTFLVRSGHPLHEIVDRVDRLGSWTQSRKTSEDRRTARRVERLIEDLLSRPEIGPEDWKRLSLQLAELERRQLRKYAPDFVGAVLRSIARHRAEAAEQAVAARLATHFAERRTHRFVADLLDSGWTTLLAAAYLEDGPDGETWALLWTQMETLDRLLAENPDERRALEPETRQALLNTLSRELDKVVLDPRIAEELLDGIAHALASESNREAATEPHQFVRYRPPLATAPRSEGPPEGWTRHAWEQQLARLRQLTPGKMVRVRDSKGRTHDLQIAWIDPDKTRVVCVDHSSGKVRSLTMENLARVALRESEIQISPFDRPLVERLSDTIVERLQRKIREQASRDPLTRLYNRRYLTRKLRQLLDRTTSAVFCLVDLDKFGVLNNGYGYAAGDELLREVAAQLKEDFGRTATVSRVGSDEFALLFVQHTDERGAEALAQEVLESVRAVDFRWEGMAFPVDASVGVVCIEGRERDPDAIFGSADSARQVAKNQGGGRVWVYRVDDTQIAWQQRLTHWAVRIKDILSNDRLLLRRQEIRPVLAAAGRPRHYEVLLTAADEQGRSISTAEFVRAAEECQSMPAVDRWVIARTFQWLADHPPDRGVGHYAVNLSGQSLRDDSLLDFIVEQFEQTGAPRNKVAFEITETAAMQRLDEAAQIIQALRDLGCPVALDDFGTGLSSYAYLNTLPVDQIKIDGWFVQRMDESDADLAVVKSINELAHFMGKETVAESVESQAVLERLTDLGVDYAQGYWIHKPQYLDKPAS